MVYANMQTCKLLFKFSREETERDRDRDRCRKNVHNVHEKTQKKNPRRRNK